MTIDIGAGKEVFIRTGANVAKMRISRVVSYQQALIVFGGSQRTVQTYLPEVVGQIDVKARPMCAIAMPNEPYEPVAMVRDALRGLVLFFVEDTHAQTGIPILNMAINKEWYADPARMSESAMVDRATRLIDCYNEWRRSGNIPKWILDVQGLRGQYQLVQPRAPSKLTLPPHYSSN